jgi:hypothetical protein
VEVPLVGHLEALERRDLETLLRRRPEARSLIGAKRCDVAALAEAISRPEGVVAAADALNGFLRNLLHAALFLGPRASASSLSALAPGVDPQALAAGAGELSRWGLAFVAPGDPVDAPPNGQAATSRGGSVEPPPNGSGTIPPAGTNGSSVAAVPGNWRLFVPACVLNVVSLPEGLAVRLARALANRSPAFLAAIAGNLELERRAASTVPELVAEISTALGEPARVTRLLAKAPSGSREIVDMARKLGGVVVRDDLVGRGLASWHQPHWTGKGVPTSPLAWLESRGLLVVAPSTLYDEGPIAVPAEVEVALRGGRLFESWPPPKPPALNAGRSSRATPAKSAAAKPAHLAVGDPGRSVADLEALLDLWAQAPSPSLQKGGLGVRELRRAAKTLSLPEPYVGFLYALAVETGLLAQDEGRRVVPSAAVAGWAAKPAPQKWAGLFESYLGGMLWAETGGGLVNIDRVEYRGYLVRLRRSLVAELAALPEGTPTDVKSLGRRLLWRHPALIHCEECGTNLTSLVTQALGWLGTLAPPPALSLLEPARSAVADPRWTELTGPGSAAFAPTVSEITVGADLSIIVAGPPVAALGALLARFADLQASSPARIFRLSEASVRRALDGGMKGSEITAALQAHAPRGLPQNVAYLIDDVAHRHGHLVVGRAGLYVRSDDPALLATAAADRRLASFAPRLLAPTVILLEGDDPAKVLTALRSAGYLPVAEAGGVAISTSKAVGASPAPLRPVVVGLSGAPWSDLAPKEAESLAEALLKGSRAPAPALSSGHMPAGDQGCESTCTNPDDIRRLLELAADEELVVEIGYVTSRGRTSMREVEPYMVLSTRLYATNHLTGAELTIRLDRVASARVTGQADGEDLDDDPEGRSEGMILLMGPSPSR